MPNPGVVVATGYVATHPMIFNSICPKNSKNSRFEELKEIYGDIYIYIYVAERASGTPPAGVWCIYEGMWEIM
jgi:hypothetical protein